jgi:hypothetical protein
MKRLIAFVVLLAGSGLAVLPAHAEEKVVVVHHRRHRRHHHHVVVVEHR